MTVYGKILERLKREVVAEEESAAVEPGQKLTKQRFIQEFLNAELGFDSYAFWANNKEHASEDEKKLSPSTLLKTLKIYGEEKEKQEAALQAALSKAVSHEVTLANLK